MIDENKIERAVKLFLEAIGENPERPGLLDTPKRISAMCHELFAGYENIDDASLEKTFAVDNSDMILQKDIDFYSMCEHHLLPFWGKAHVAYIPDGKVLGLSKLSRCVEIFSRKLQLQEKLTIEIADKISELVQPKGIIVMLEAQHMCMTMRGIKKSGAKTFTYASRGCFESDLDLSNKFFALVK